MRNGRNGGDACWAVSLQACDPRGEGKWLVMSRTTVTSKHPPDNNGRLGGHSCG